MAVAVIPPLCNAVISPIMKKFAPKADGIAEKSTIAKQPLNSKVLLQSNNALLRKKDMPNSFQSFYSNYSIGMRV